MLIDSVIAYAFGALCEQRLELTPGMNVVCGPNEAGKSTWHAAVFAGLCGMRRVRGKSSAEDQRFADRHRPWDGPEWEVGACIRLADGRRIELRHDLAGRVKSRATDMDLGRDCSDEIISEGSPDGSRWLGLNRRVFAATACIRQADVLAVLNDPGALQEALQRAADSGGADATAAAALARIERFRAEHVGTDRASSSRPLRLAVQELDAAQRARVHAEMEHGEHARLAQEIEGLQALVESSAPALPESELGAEALRTRLAALKRELAEPLESPPPWLAGLGGLGAVGGIGLVLAGLLLQGVALLGAGALLLGWYGAQRARLLKGQRRKDALEEERRPLEDRLARRQDLEARQAEYEQQVHVARLRLAELRGQREQLVRTLPNVAEAEERFMSAEAELGRVRDLDRVLGLTQQFLARAQDRVHRSVAPVLAEAVRGRLCDVSGGRYADVRVDPASLAVQVLDARGTWRDAALLSHGTAEQIYLLLRVALAEQLTVSGEVCPLILDDVTAHCDDARTEAVLAMLHEISRERQVVLFSQEMQVRHWAEKRLRHDVDRLALL